MFLAVPTLSSCGVNFDAQTDQYYDPTDGTSNRDGAVKVIDAVIISDQPGSGRLIAALVNSDGSVGAPVGIADEGTDTSTATPTQAPQDDTLTGVQGVGVDQSITFTLEGGDTTIPAGGTLQLADQGSAVVGVSGDAERVSPGGFVELKFIFQNAEEATLEVPVLPPDDTYSDIPIPSPSASGTPGLSGESPSALPSESPSASSSQPAKPRKPAKKG